MNKPNGRSEGDENFLKKIWQLANNDFPPWLIKTVEWVLIIASFILAVSAVFGNLDSLVFVHLSLLIAALSLIVGIEEAPGLKKLPSLGTGMIVFVITLIIVACQFFGI